LTNESIKTVIAEILNQMNKPIDLKQIEPLSKIYGKTPVYMSYFIALDKEINDNKLPITYTNHKGEIKQKVIKTDNTFIENMFDAYLRLSVSKQGFGREGNTKIITNAVKGVLLSGDAKRTQVGVYDEQHDL